MDVPALVDFWHQVRCSNVDEVASGERDEEARLDPGRYSVRDHCAEQTEQTEQKGQPGGQVQEQGLPLVLAGGRFSGR